MFKIKKIENKTVYYSDILPCEHFFTTREIEVKDNIEVIANYLNIEKENIIKPTQVHSNHVEIVDDRKEYPNCDGLILNQKNKAIYLNFADCTPIIIFDSENHIASVVHAGWRGTVQKIAPVAIKKMMEKFNTNPKDIIALIGPCISFEQFETSSEAIMKLSDSVKDKTGLFKGNFADLKGINKRQLEEIGVKQIDVCPFCTVLDNDKFFSYRKENQTTKRHSAIIKL